MLVVAIVFAIYLLLQQVIVDLPIENRIEQSSCTEETIALRKKLKKRRTVF